ncbi:MAG: hypothetical protein ABI972_10005 [Acidobacteriota bacterium]
MRLTSLALLLAALVLSAECIHVNPIQYGSLRVIGYDGTGGKDTVREAELRDLYSGKTLYTTRTDTFARVEAGRYLLLAVVPGFKTARSEVYVSPGTT